LGHGALAERPVREVGVAQDELAPALPMRGGQRRSHQVAKGIGAGKRAGGKRRLFLFVVHGHSFSGCAQPAAIHPAIASRAAALAPRKSLGASLRRSANVRIRAASRPAARRLSPLMNTCCESYIIRVRRSSTTPPTGLRASPPSSNQTCGLGSV